MKTNHPWPPELIESIKQLYRVFASYEAEPSSIGPCPCCINDDDLKALFAKPLRELDAETISPFASNAVATHGSVTDLKHFLPRICELFPDALCEFTAPEIYLSTLRSSEWLAWPEKEMLAVRSFMFQWWRWTLTNYPPSPPGGDAISAIAQAEGDLSPYLIEWDLQCRNVRSALRQLVDFYHANLVVHGRQNRLSLGLFWKERAVQDSQVCRWLLRDKTRGHIERAKQRYAAEWGLETEIGLILVHQEVWRNSPSS